MSSDPFYPVLVECIFAAQGLIHAGNGALMTMMPEKTTLPASPRLDASPEVVRALGYAMICLYVTATDCSSIITLVVGSLYIQAVYQGNRGFMQGSMLLRVFTAAIFWGNGFRWRPAALLEVGLAFVSGVCLLLESQAKGQRRKR